MATLTLKVKLEAEALGPVMIILKKTPGVIGFDIDEETFGATPPAKVSGKNLRDVVLDQFALGEPVTTDQVATAIGGARQRTHTALNGLAKHKLVRSISKGTWALTAKGRALLGLPAQKLLPAPKAKPAAKAKGNGHAKPVHRGAKGETIETIRKILEKRGPSHPREISAMLPQYGIASGAASGALWRGQKAGLLQKQDDGRYALTTAKSEG